MKRTMLIFSLSMITMMLTSCGGHKEDNEGHVDGDEPGVVHFPKEMSDKLDFKVEKATEQAVGSVIHTVAQLCRRRMMSSLSVPRSME